MNPSQWRVVGASVCGASHEKTGQPCQDAHHWLALADGTVLAAVADGAGSAAFSDIGAALAAQTAVKTLATALSAGSAAAGGGLGSTDVPVHPEPTGTAEPQGPVRAPDPTAVEEAACKHWLIEALVAARAALEAEASARGVPARELASTLLVVMARTGFIAAAQVGDGAVVAAAASGEVFALTTPRSGEYLNETTFLTSPDALSQLQLGIWRGDLAHWAMFTDGLQMLALRVPGGTPYAPFFIPLFQFLANPSVEAESQTALTRFLRSPRLRDRADDDLTLVVGTHCG